MNKRITSLLLFVVMILSTLAIAVPVLAASPYQLDVSADKTEAHPGDIITFTITLGPVQDMGTMQMDLVIPEGLTYVANSGKIADGLKEKLGFDAGADWTEVTKRITGGTSGLEGDYTSTEDTVIATFQCKVNDDFLGTAEVGLDNLEFYSVPEFEEHTSKYTANPAKITVTPQPIPATGITLNKATLTLTAGKNETLVATLDPSTSTDTVTWSSDNTSVATVDSNGKVTAVKKGTATITAKANDSVKATCAVTVNCAHTNLVKTDKKVSTCLVQGNNEYYTCGDCGVVLKADKATQTTVAAETLPLADHAYGALTVKVEPNHKAQTDGKISYYECAVCHKFFDENKKEKTAAELVIKVTTHSASAGAEWKTNETNHWKECDAVTGCGVVLDGTKVAHSFAWVIDHAATEDATGLKHEECSVCKYKRSENTVIPKLDHTHTGITNHPAVPATCKADGMKEYWTCSSSKCAGKYYSDAACASETTLEALTVAKDAKNHAGGTEKKGAVAATCDTAGRGDDTYCLGCGEKIAEGTVIPKLGHDYSAVLHNDTQHWNKCSRCDSTTAPEAHKGGEATCVSKAACSVCGIAYGELDAANHKHTEVRDAKAATEEAEGYSGDTWCTDCDTKLESGEVVPKLDHAHAMVKTDAKAATHDADGNIEYYTCSKCGKIYNDAIGTRELTEDDLVIQKGEHSYGTDWESDKDNHWHECACGSKNDVAAHETELKNAKEATKTEKGYTGDKVCKICGYTVEKGKEIPVLAKPDPSNPDTGNNMAMSIWAALLFMSGAGVVCTRALGKKRGNRA